MRPHPRRARTNSTSPRAWGTSDRGGWIGNQENLLWQYEWAGTTLINTRALVYADEYDRPQRQLGTIILPPDPVSILNARPEQYYIDEYANILFEVNTPLSIEGGFSGAEAGDPIYAENSTPGNTIAIVLEYNQYFQLGQPDFAAADFNNPDFSTLVPNP